ncbi:MAG: hypothetical protein MRY49_02690 [Candidatus Pacebacteria bacterium]|nr:hypothetical protein [Candidatus Paceibacterota bacterium]
MKKILLINGGVKKFAEEFLASCKKNNLECARIRTHFNSVLLLDNSKIKYVHLGEEIDLKSFKYAFIRVRGRYSHFTSLLGYILKAYNITFNDVSNLDHTMGDEKITQMVRFALSGIPIPKTLIFSLDSFPKNRDFILENTSFPCVLKTNGSKGRDVWKINDAAELEEKMSSIEQELVMVQELVPNSYDIRALFFYGELLGAVERSSTDGFYNNAAKGGKLKETKLSKEEINLSKKACEVLDLDFGGVDFVRTEKGILFFEVNKGPQIYGLESATGLDIPDLVVQKIIDRFL